MAAITSNASGNWSAGGTWVGGVAPGNGDTATIASGHAVTVDTSTTVGSSPASGGTAAIQVNGTGSLTIATGVTLTARGDVKLNNAAMTMNAGSVFRFDASQASSPSTTKYRLHIGTNHNQTSARLNVNGTSGNRCTISSVKTSSAGNGFISGSDGVDDWLQGGLITGSYCDLTNIGDASNPSLYFGLTSTASFSIDNFVFDSCGKIQTSFNIADGTDLSITNCTMKNTLASECMQLNSPNANTSDTRVVKGCIFDKLVELYPCRAIAIGGAGAGEWCIFNGGIDTTNGSGKWASMTNCMLRETSAPYGDMTDCYVLADGETDNPHPIQLAANAGAGLTFHGVVFECPDSENTTDAGDLVSHSNPASVVTNTIEHCLAIPNGDGTSPGVLSSMLGGANTRVAINNNTWALTADDPTSNEPALGSVGETHNAASGQVTSFKNNIAYSPTSRNALLFRNINGAPNSDVVSAANADYNLMWNMLAGSEGKGYDQPITGSPGANDLNEDPDFVDITRNISTWDDDLGGAGTVANALAELNLKNEAGYDSSYTVPALWTWVRAGFAPQNQNLAAAGDGGVDIGAVPVVAAAPSTGGLLLMMGVG